MNQTLRGLTCVFAGLVTLCGCSGEPHVPRGTAKGKITFQNQPVSEGTVIFENIPMGVSVMTALNPDGTYVVSTYRGDGVPVGTYQVAVSPRRISNGDPMIVGPPTKTREPSTFPPIPKKYLTPPDSGLTADVKEGENPPFNFDVTK